MLIEHFIFNQPEHFVFTVPYTTAMNATAQELANRDVIEGVHFKKTTVK